VSGAFKEVLAACGADLAGSTRARQGVALAPSPLIGLPPDVESLELRRHFAVTAALVGTVVVITGDSGNNYITVAQQQLLSGNQIEIDTDNDGIENYSYLVSSVSKIQAYLGGGNDTIAFASNDVGPFTGNMNVGRPAEVYGEAGVDVIDGPDNGDTLDGGYGNDTINGHGGADTILGGKDNDNIDGGAGNDSIVGGETFNPGIDNDSLYGGEGNDTIYGWYGYDTLDGGGGNDYLDGGDEGDTIVDYSGADTLIGGAGDDSLDAAEGDPDDVLDGGSGTDSGLNGDGDTLFNLES
jgi:Ca2+-binding RTX toxin-like protein